MSQILTLNGLAAFVRYNITSPNFSWDNLLPPVTLDRKKEVQLDFLQYMTLAVWYHRSI